MQKTYLGDGAYAHFDERGLVLTTENGIETTNTVVLEQHCIANLMDYLMKLGGFKEYLKNLIRAEEESA